MIYHFDTVIDRRGTASLKWNKYGEDVLPLWVADMDFVSAEPVLRALHRRVDHGIFGYTHPTWELRGVIRERLKRLYGWQVQDDDLLFLPSIVSGLNVSFHAYAGSGDGVLV